MRLSATPDLIRVESGLVAGRHVETLRAAIHQRVEAGEDVVIDLAGADAVDLTTLRMLAAASRAAARSGRRLTLRGCSPAVRRVLAVTHLRRLVRLEPESATSGVTDRLGASPG